VPSSSSGPMADNRKMSGAVSLLAPLVGILRGIDPGFFPELMAAAFSAGLSAIEVTMNTPGACEMVAAARPAVPQGRLLGMGTIRNLGEAEKAIAAGAMFMVTPNLDPDVITFAHRHGVPVIAGAFTPTEVFQAWDRGADMVKVFPVRAGGGPDYIRELKGPFDHIPMVAVGGVSPANVREYFNAGAEGVGVGTSLFGKAALEKRDPEAAAASVRDFLQRIPVRRQMGK